MKAIPKPRRIRDAKYLKFVREQGCVFDRKRNGATCKGDGIDAHHVKPAGGGIMGSKVSDFRTVGLCRLHHQMAENYPSSYRFHLEQSIIRLNAAYRKRHPIVAPRKTRTQVPTARIEIRHCVCGRSHSIEYSKTVDDAGFRRIYYRCPVTNNEAQALTK